MLDRLSDAAELQVCAMPEPRRHFTICAAVEKLAAGQAILLITDRDPLPIQFQLDALDPGHLDWHYIESGPQIWRVRIDRR